MKVTCPNKDKCSMSVRILCTHKNSHEKGCYCNLFIGCRGEGIKCEPDQPRFSRFQRIRKTEEI